jgi:myo-inositol 2-dehydrogenase/D-chiro-inositol 1-dehydrogenase
MTTIPPRAAEATPPVPLRLGLLGCGAHASRTIHPSLVRVDDVRIVAACDLQEDRVARTAARYGARPYTDYRQMLAHEGLDAVLVIGPPAIHHQLGLEVLRAGKHLIVEKPPANSAAQARELVEEARRRQVMGAVSTHWRHSPAHRKMREILHSAAFGSPTYFEGHFYAPSPTSPGVHDSVFRAYLWDQGVHLVDCTRFLMGDIAEVRATGVEGAGGAIGLNLTLRFSSGCIGSLALVSAAPIMEHYVGALGDGRARVQVFDQDRLEYQAVPPWDGQGGYADVPAQAWRPGASAHAMANTIAYVEEHRHFARALLAGEQPHASLEDGYRTLCVLEAADTSLKTGQTVAVAQD